MNSFPQRNQKFAMLSDQIVTRKIVGETFLVPIRGELVDLERIFVLNTVGEYIWKHLDGKKSLDEIVDEIVATFEVEQEEAEKDICEFVANLLAEGLIREGG